jgi:arginine exporter protein ArgO
VLELSIFGYIVVATWVLQMLARDEAQSGVPVAWQDAALIFGVSWLWFLSLPWGFYCLRKEEEEIIAWRHVASIPPTSELMVKVQKPKKRKGKKK